MPVPPRSPTLRTPRLILRAIEEDDAADIVPISFYSGAPATSVEDALRMLRQIAVDQERGDTVHWGLASPDDGKIVGTCGYYRGLAGARGEIGYVLKQEHRGRGLMTEAVGAIAAWGIEALGLQTIVAYTGADNLPSRAVLEKVGFRATGVEKKGYLEYMLSRGPSDPR
jgi:ribosomal-protein-alanine N-acetyltransferase